MWRAKEKENMIQEGIIKAMYLRMPFVFDWVNFKGETVFGSLNYAESERVGRPMIDIFPCATRALNHAELIKTVQFDKNKFKPSHLTKSWGSNKD